MLEVIGNRELIVLDGLGVRLQGAYHRVSAAHESQRRLDAGHFFANHDGRNEAEQHMADRLVAHFPLSKLEFSAMNVAALFAGEDRNNLRKSQKLGREMACALERR
jgi:hypothetical protein